MRVVIRRALIIGIGQGHGYELEDRLASAVESALQVKGEIEQGDYWELQSAIGEVVNAAEVVDRLDWFLAPKPAGAELELFLFYIGHGKPSSYGVSILATDGTVVPELANIISRASTLGPTNSFFVWDCCFAGNRQNFANVRLARNMTVLVSASDGEAALELDNGRSAATDFARYFIEALRGHRDGQLERIKRVSAADVVGYVLGNQFGTKYFEVTKDGFTAAARFDQHFAIVDNHYPSPNFTLVDRRLLPVGAFNDPAVANVPPDARHGSSEGVSWIRKGADLELSLKIGESSVVHWMTARSILGVGDEVLAVCGAGDIDAFVVVAGPSGARLLRVDPDGTAATATLTENSNVSKAEFGRGSDIGSIVCLESDGTTISESWIPNLTLESLEGAF